MSAVQIVDAPPISTRQLWSSFIAAEWIKLRTVRSTVITLVVALVLAVGFGALACERLAQHLSEFSSPFQRADYMRGLDPTSQSLIGNAIAQLAIGALGVLVVTSEFGSGMIRASIIAMPQRQRWIGAKLAVFTGVALVVGQLLTFTSFWVGQAMLSSQHAGVSLGHPGVLKSVVATGLYVALVGLLGATLGLIIKHTAGALTTLLGAIFVLPAITSAFPEPLQGHVARFLPESIGERAATVGQLSERFSTWEGIALMAGYALILFVVGSVLLQRRDA
jgi:ABC-2 type transport system permease protein